jgi:hypothetical protein
MFITGDKLVDTADKFIGGVNDTSDLSLSQIFLIGGVIDTRDKFITGVVDTTDKFSAGINDNGEQLSPVTTALVINFSLVSTIPAITFFPNVVDTGHK